MHDAAFDDRAVREPERTSDVGDRDEFCQIEDQHSFPHAQLSNNWGENVLGIDQSHHDNTEIEMPLAIKLSCYICIRQTFKYAGSALKVNSHSFRSHSNTTIIQKSGDMYLDTRKRKKTNGKT